MFVESVPSGKVSEFFLVPLSYFSAVLVFDMLHLNLILTAKFEPVFVTGMHKDFALHRVPVLSVDLFQLGPSNLKGVEMHSRAGFANEHTVVQLKVSRLITHAIDTISVELIFCHTLPQKCLQFRILLLRRVFWDYFLHNRRCSCLMRSPSGFWLFYISCLGLSWLLV